MHYDATHKMKERAILLPLSLFLRLYNELSDGSLLRCEIIEFIRTYKRDVAIKGHIAEGFRVVEDGALVFDEQLCDEAVYRGKMETYGGGALKDLRKIVERIAIAKEMADKRNIALEELNPRLLEERVGEGPAVSDEVTMLLSVFEPTQRLLQELDESGAKEPPGDDDENRQE